MKVINLVNKITVRIGKISPNGSENSVLMVMAVKNKKLVS